MASHPQFWRIAGLCAVLKVLETLNTSLSAVPRLRLFEATICRSYYLAHDPSVIDAGDNVPENLCKIAQVQSNLAQLTGWNFFFSYIPALLLAIPYSALGERVSKRTILLVNVSSGIISQLYVLAICYFYNTFDIRLIWVASLFDFFGGGKLVFTTMTQVLIAKTTAPSALTTVFFRLTSVLSISRVLGVTSGSYLLGLGVWIPIWLALAFYTLCIPVTIWLKDPQDNLSLQKDSSEQGDHLLQELDQSGARHSIDSQERGEHGNHTENTSNAKVDKLPLQPMSLLRSFSTYLSFMLHHHHILGIFFLHEVGMGIQNIMEQWTSQRYEWPLSVIGYILASETFISSIFLAVLPTITRFLSRGSRAPIPRQQKQQQFYIMRGSLLTAATGVAMIAASGSNRPVFLVALAIYALGVGFRDALVSYVTGLLESNSITKMYMCISIVQTCANILNGPVWAWFYTVGMNYGARGMPLPFILCCLLFLAVLALVMQLA